MNAQLLARMFLPDVLYSAAKNNEPLGQMLQDDVGHSAALCTAQYECCHGEQEWTASSSQSVKQ